MKCGFEYCVYNRGFTCIAEGVEINSSGMCDTCIMLSLNEGFFEKEKEKHLMELEKRWNGGK